MCCVNGDEFNLKGPFRLSIGGLVSGASGRRGNSSSNSVSIKVVAVKKLVAVGLVRRFVGPPFGCVLYGVRRLSGERCHAHAWYGIRSIYFEEIRVFTAGFCPEYVSME